MRQALFWLFLFVASLARAAGSDVVEIRHFAGPDASPTKINQVIQGEWTTDPTVKDPRVRAQAKVTTQLVQEVLARPEVAPTLDELRTLTTEFNGLPSQNRWNLNSDGKIHIVIDATAPGTGMDGSAFAGERSEVRTGGTVTGDVRPGTPPDRATRSFVRIPVSYLDARLFVSGRSKEQAAQALADVLVHELAHTRHKLALAVATGRYWAAVPPEARDTLRLIGRPTGPAKPHDFFTISDPQRAFNEGFAEAEELFAFKEKNRIWDKYSADMYRADGHWSTFLSNMPAEIKPLVAAAIASERPVQVGEKYMWENLRQQFGYTGTTESLLEIKPSGQGAPTFDHITRCEGVVACTLVDLYEHGLTSPAEVLELTKLKPPNNLNDLLGGLKAKFTRYPELQAKLERIVDRRTFGLYTKGPEVGPHWKLLLEGKIDHAKFLSEVEKIVGPKLDVPEHAALIAERPKAGTINVAVEGTPGKRAAALAGLTDPKVVRGHATMVTAQVVTTAALIAITKGGRIDLGKVASEAIAGVASPEMLGGMMLNVGVDRLAERGVPAAEKVLLGWNQLPQRMTRLALKGTPHFLGFVGMLVTDVIMRQILNHSYIWKCQASPAKAIAYWTWCALSDFSQWTRDDVLAVVMGGLGAAAGLALATCYLPTTWIAVGTVVVGAALAYLGTLIANVISWAWDKLEYRSVKSSLREAMDALASPDPKAPPAVVNASYVESEQRPALEQAATVDAKRAALALVLGIMGDQKDERCGCEVKVPSGPKPRTIEKGLFARFLYLRNKKLTAILSEMQSEIQDRQKEMAERQKELDEATNPLHQEGISLRQLSNFLAYDDQGNPVSAKELADYLTYACAVDSVTRKVVGRDLPPEPKEQDFENLYNDLRGQLEQLLFSVQGDLLLKMHANAIIEHRRRAERAREEYRQFGRTFAKDLADHMTAKIKKSSTVIQEELDDLTALLAAPAGDELKTAAPELHQFLTERKEGLATVVPTYQSLAEALREAAEAAQRQP